MSSEKAILVLLLLICALFNILGDYFAKVWSAGGNGAGAWKMWLAGGFYCTLTAAWMYGLNRMQHLGRWTCIWTIISLAAGVLMSQLIFHEPMTIKTWVGIGFAAVSLALLI
jgi:drug/metabolite transporter (DMT)-like permease